MVLNSNIPQWSYANNTIHFGKLTIFFGSYTTIGNTGQYNFPTNTFATKCLAVIPYSVQMGFGATSTMSIGTVTKDSFQYFTFTSPAANLAHGFVAFGY